MNANKTVKNKIKRKLAQNNIETYIYIKCETGKWGGLANIFRVLCKAT